MSNEKTNEGLYDITLTHSGEVMTHRWADVCIFTVEVEIKDKDGKTAEDIQLIGLRGKHKDSDFSQILTIADLNLDRFYLDVNDFLMEPGTWEMEVYDYLGEAFEPVAFDFEVIRDPDRYNRENSEVIMDKSLLLPGETVNFTFITRNDANEVRDCIMPEEMSSVVYTNYNNNMGVLSNFKQVAEGTYEASYTTQQEEAYYAQALVYNPYREYYNPFLPYDLSSDIFTYEIPGTVHISNLYSSLEMTDTTYPSNKPMLFNVVLKDEDEKPYDPEYPMLTLNLRHLEQQIDMIEWCNLVKVSPGVYKGEFLQTMQGTYTLSAYISEDSGKKVLLNYYDEILITEEEEEVDVPDILPEGYIKLNTKIDLSTIKFPTKAEVDTLLDSGEWGEQCFSGHLLRTDLIMLLIGYGKHDTLEVFKDFEGYPDVAWESGRMCLNEKLKDTVYDIGFDKDLNFYASTDPNKTMLELSNELKVDLFDHKCSRYNEGATNASWIAFDNDSKPLLCTFDRETRKDIVVYMSDNTPPPVNTVYWSVGDHRWQSYNNEDIDVGSVVVRDFMNRGFVVGYKSDYGPNGQVNEYTLTPEAKDNLPLYPVESYFGPPTAIVKDGVQDPMITFVIDTKNTVYGPYDNPAEIPDEVLSNYPLFNIGNALVSKITPIWEMNGTIVFGNYGDYNAPRIEAYNKGWYPNPEWSGKAFHYDGTLCFSEDENFDPDRAIHLDNKLGAVNLVSDPYHFYNLVYPYGGVSGVGEDGKFLTIGPDFYDIALYRTSSSYNEDGEEVYNVSSFKPKGSAKWLGKGDVGYDDIVMPEGIPFATTWMFSSTALFTSDDAPNNILADGTVIKFGEPNYRLPFYIEQEDLSLSTSFDSEGRGYTQYDGWNKDGTYYRVKPDVNARDLYPETENQLMSSLFSNEDLFTMIKPGEEGYVPFPLEDKFIAIDTNGFNVTDMRHVPSVKIDDDNVLPYGYPNTSLPTTWDHQDGVWGFDHEGKPRSGSREVVTGPTTWDVEGTRWQYGINNYDGTRTPMYEADWNPDPLWVEHSAVTFKGLIYSKDLDNTDHTLMIFDKDKGYQPHGTPNTIIYNKVLTNGGLIGFDKDGVGIKIDLKTPDYSAYSTNGYKPKGQDNWIGEDNPDYVANPEGNTFNAVGYLTTTKSAAAIVRGEDLPSRLTDDGKMVKYGEVNYRMPDYVDYERISTFFHGFAPNGKPYTFLDFWHIDGRHFRVARPAIKSNYFSDKDFFGQADINSNRLALSNRYYYVGEEGDTNYADYPFMDRFIAVDADGFYVHDPIMVPKTLKDGKEIPYGMPGSELPASWDHRDGVWGFDDDGNPKTGNRFGAKVHVWDDDANFYPTGLEGEKFAPNTQGWVHPLLVKDEDLDILAITAEGKLIRDASKMPVVDGIKYGEPKWLAPKDIYIIKAIGYFKEDGSEASYKNDGYMRELINNDYWLSDGTYARLQKSPGNHIFQWHDFIKIGQAGYVAPTEEAILSLPFGTVVSSNWKIPPFYEVENDTMRWYNSAFWKISRGCKTLNGIIEFDANGDPIREGEVVVNEYVYNFESNKGLSDGLTPILFTVTKKRKGTTSPIDISRVGKVMAVKRVDDNVSYVEPTCMVNRIDAMFEEDVASFAVFAKKPMSEELVFIDEDETIADSTFTVTFEGDDLDAQPWDDFIPGKMVVEPLSGYVWYSKTNRKTYGEARVSVLSVSGKLLKKPQGLITTTITFDEIVGEDGYAHIELDARRTGDVGSEHEMNFTLFAKYHNSLELIESYTSRVFSEPQTVVSMRDSIYIGHNNNQTVMHVQHVTDTSWGFQVLPNPPEIKLKNISYYEPDKVSFNEVDINTKLMRQYVLGVGEDIITEDFEDARLDFTIVDLIDGVEGKVNLKKTVLVHSRDLEPLYKDGTIYDPNSVQLKLTRSGETWIGENVVYTGETRKTDFEFFIELPDGKKKVLKSGVRCITPSDDYTRNVIKYAYYGNVYDGNYYVISGTSTELGKDQIKIVTDMGVSTDDIMIQSRYSAAYGAIVQVDHTESFDSKTKPVAGTLYVTPKRYAENGIDLVKVENIPDLMIEPVSGVQLIEGPTPLPYAVSGMSYSYFTKITVPPLSGGISRLRVTSKVADIDQFIEIMVVSEWENQELEGDFDKVTVTVPSRDVKFSLLSDEEKTDDFTLITVEYFKRDGSSYQPNKVAPPWLTVHYNEVSVDETEKYRAESGDPDDNKFYYTFRNPTVNIAGNQTWSIRNMVSRDTFESPPVAYLYYRPMKIKLKSSSFSVVPEEYELGSDGVMIYNAFLIGEETNKKLLNLDDIILTFKNEEGDNISCPYEFVGDLATGSYHWNLYPETIGTLWINFNSVKGDLKDHPTKAVVLALDPGGVIDRDASKVSYPDDERYPWSGKPSPIVFDIVLEGGGLFKNAPGTVLEVYSKEECTLNDLIGKQVPKFNDAGSASWDSYIYKPTYYVKVVNKTYGFNLGPYKINYFRDERPVAKDPVEGQVFFDISKSLIIANGVDVAFLDVQMKDPDYPEYLISDPESITLVNDKGETPNCNFTVIKMIDESVRIIITSSWEGKETLFVKRGKYISDQQFDMSYVKNFTYKTPKNTKDDIYFSNRVPRIKKGDKSTLTVTAFLYHDDMPSIAIEDIILLDNANASGTTIRYIGEIGLGVYKWEVDVTTEDVLSLQITGSSVFYESDEFSITPVFAENLNPGYFDENRITINNDGKDGVEVVDNEIFFVLKDLEFSLTLYDKEDPTKPLDVLEDVWFERLDGSRTVANIATAPGNEPGELLVRVSTNFKYKEELIVCSKNSRSKATIILNNDRESENTVYYDNCDVYIPSHSYTATKKDSSIVKIVAELHMRNKYGGMIKGLKRQDFNKFNFKYIAGSDPDAVDAETHYGGPDNSVVSIEEIRTGVYLMTAIAGLPGTYRLTNTDFVSLTKLGDLDISVKNEYFYDKDNYVSPIAYITQRGKVNGGDDRKIDIDADMIRPDGTVRVTFNVHELDHNYSEQRALYLLQEDPFTIPKLKDDETANIESMEFVKEESDLPNGKVTYDFKLVYSDDITDKPVYKRLEVASKVDGLSFAIFYYTSNPYYKPDLTKASKYKTFLRLMSSKGVPNTHDNVYEMFLNLSNIDGTNITPTSLDGLELLPAYKANGDRWEFVVERFVLETFGIRIFFKPITVTVDRVLGNEEQKEFVKLHKESSTRLPVERLKFRYKSDIIDGGDSGILDISDSSSNNTNVNPAENSVLDNGYLLPKQDVSIPELLPVMNSDNTFDAFEIGCTYRSAMGGGGFTYTNLSSNSIKNNAVGPVLVPLDESLKDAFKIDVDKDGVKVKVLKPELVKDKVVVFGIKVCGNRQPIDTVDHSGYIALKCYDDGSRDKHTYDPNQVLPNTMKLSWLSGNSNLDLPKFGNINKVMYTPTLYNKGIYSLNKLRVNIRANSTRDTNFEFGRTDLDMIILNSHKPGSVDRIKHEYEGSIEPDLFGIHWEFNDVRLPGWVHMGFTGTSTPIAFKEHVVSIVDNLSQSENTEKLYNSEDYEIEVSKNFILSDGIDTARIKIRYGLKHDNRVPYLQTGYLYVKGFFGDLKYVGSPEYGVYEYEVSSKKKGRDFLLAPLSNKEQDKPSPHLPKMFTFDEEGNRIPTDNIINYGEESELREASQHTTTFEVNPNKMDLQGFEPSVSIVTLVIRNSRSEILPGYDEPILEFKNTPNKPKVEKLGEVEPGTWQWKCSFDKGYSDKAKLYTPDNKFTTSEVMFLVTDTRGEEDDRLGRFSQDTLTISTDKPSIINDGVEEAIITVRAFRLHEPTVPMVTKQPVTLVADTFTMATVTNLPSTEPGVYRFMITSLLEGSEKLHFKTPYAVSTKGVLETYARPAVPTDMFSCPMKNNCISSLLSRKFAKPGTVEPIPADADLSDPGSFPHNCNVGRAIYLAHKAKGTFDKLDEES